MQLSTISAEPPPTALSACNPDAAPFTGRWYGRYSVVAMNVGFVIACSLVLRTVMLWQFADWRSLSLGEVLSIFTVGLRFDLLVGLCYVLPQMVHLSLVGNGWLAGRISRCLLDFEWFVGLMFLPFICVAEFMFFEEFQTRLNYIAFEYLVYPTEVCCNIWQSYPVVELMSVVLVVGGVLWLLARRAFLKRLTAPVEWVRRSMILSAYLAAIGALWATLGMATFQITSDRVANECAANGLYSFVAYAWTCNVDYDHHYLTIEEHNALERLRSEVLADGGRLAGEFGNPVDRIVDSGEPQRNWNVVIVVEESLGSEFIGVQGGVKGLSANFDELTEDGVLLNNIYATGNRTARALEAILTSMPPIPTEAILKRDHSEHVFTLAHVLAERGYERLFMTAGRGLFDGVRSFMTANGFNHFREQADFQDPVFVNAWGVSDEDLFRKALQELQTLHETGKPFFAVLLTVSNHRPYTFPDGRIPDTIHSRETAVKYADFALGYFFREVRERPYFKNTLFVVMGDHGARVTGQQLFPMSSYRVPVLFISPDGTGRGTRLNTLACSLDIAPTILGRLGGKYRSVFFGRDAFKTPPQQGRAIMQHNHDVAALNANNEMVVLGFGKSVTGFTLDPKTFLLHKMSEPNEPLTQTVAALFQQAHDLYYSDRWFTGLPPRSSSPGLFGSDALPTGGSSPSGRELPSPPVVAKPTDMR